MKHLQEIRDRLRAQQHPGAALGDFLLEHSSNPAYLCSILTIFAEAVCKDEADLAAAAKAAAASSKRPVLVQAAQMVQLQDEADPDQIEAWCSNDLVQAARLGLQAYYAVLGCEEVWAIILPQISVPNTGNNQADYESVKSQIEAAVRPQ